MNSSTTWTLLVNACVLEKRVNVANFDRIDRHFSASHLEFMLQRLAKLLGAEILSQSSVHFSPRGASAAFIVGQSNTTLFHLDKSHLACHTYFEQSDESEWQSFRLEIELSTCGDLPTEKILACISSDYNFDALLVDCQHRGFWRDRNGCLTLMDSPDSFLEGDIEFRGFQSRKMEGFSFGTLLIAEDLGDKEGEWTRLLTRPNN